jgi:hypothetical protein
MSASQRFPVFDEQLPFLNQFIRELVDAYQSGHLRSWDGLDEKVKTFFTSEHMEQMETIVPGWKKMTSYSEGVTLTHVMCVFLGLVMLPEYQSLSQAEQQLAKWIVLFHDIEKIHIRGKRDTTHGFRSAVTTANTLGNLGFPTTDEFKDAIAAWRELTNSAITNNTDKGEQIQDNTKLPEIISGIVKLYGQDTPAALIVKGVLLHMSINVVKDWPQTAPLTDTEISHYVNTNLAPLLKVMNLADSEGWSMFYPETRAIQRSETLEEFERVAEIIRKQ